MAFQLPPSIPVKRYIWSWCHPSLMQEAEVSLQPPPLQVLSDEQQRAAYNAKLEESLKDEEDDYDGESILWHVQYQIEGGGQCSFFGLQ